MLLDAPCPEARNIGEIDMKDQTRLSFEAPPGTAFYVAVKAYAGQTKSDFSNVEFFIIKDWHPSKVLYTF